jgi:hypothetical protein
MRGRARAEPSTVEHVVNVNVRVSKDRRLQGFVFFSRFILYYELISFLVDHRSHMIQR